MNAATKAAIAAITNVIGLANMNAHNDVNAGMTVPVINPLTAVNADVKAPLRNPFNTVPAVLISKKLSFNFLNIVIALPTPNSKGPIAAAIPANANIKFFTGAGKSKNLLIKIGFCIFSNSGHEDQGYLCLNSINHKKKWIAYYRRVAKDLVGGC